MSTFGQMRDNARSEVIEPTPGFWSNGEFNAWLSDAAIEAAKRARIEIQTPVIVPTVIGQEFYALPSDFYLMKKVDREGTAGQGDYTPIFASALDNRYPTQDIPIMYYIYGVAPAQLGLIPTPNGVYNIRYWYYRAQLPYAADSDVPIIRAEWHSLLEKYAIAMAKRKSDDPAFQVYLDQYNAGLIKLTTDEYQRQEGGHFPMVQDDWDNVR